MVSIFVCLPATPTSGFISSLNRMYLKVYQWLDLGTKTHTYCIATGICGPTGARAEERLEPTNSITTYAGIEKTCNK